MASKKQRKTEILAVKYANGAIVCETEFDKQKLGGLPVGSAVRIIPLSHNRNYKHHKKLFSLLEIGFEYWQPTFPVITESEKWLGYGIIDDLCQAMNASDTTRSNLKQFAEVRINKLKTERENRLDYEGMKTLEGYLNHVMLKGGFYDIKPVASGGTVKERWSIAFDNMPQETFNEVYKGVYGVIWNETLCNVYESEQALDNKISQLLGFWG
ncbi:Protein of unknown function [Pasteurella testudinis DSM 23072]|uniref:DUF1367 family protein n=1 Tax=Pasteurella testudinis DSM 23072 TaxID=1122938 RepID=A0A1W1V440_9PAST|nr:DUF1367 family protein [Pasteurella testudinis]SMB88050.1 Protein of unknown function [Pasteurella testudinis DSM 23072]SUB51613.1 Protein of uncharacterised function (DUF1367) [Pasteurella testudinis]